MISSYLNVGWLEWVWFVANFITGLCYIHITYELFHWCRGLKISGTVGIAILFQSFIVTCGVHHLSMVRFLSRHPVDPTQVAVDVAMMTASLLASVAIHYNRRQIRTVIAFISKTWREREPQ